VTNSCDVFAAQTDNSRPRFDMQMSFDHVTFRSAAAV